MVIFIHRTKPKNTKKAKNEEEEEAIRMMIGLVHGGVSSVGRKSTVGRISETGWFQAWSKRVRLID